MITMTNICFPQLQELPATLPKEGAISTTPDAGVPVFRASTTVQTHTDDLLYKQIDIATYRRRSRRTTPVQRN